MVNTKLCPKCGKDKPISQDMTVSAFDPRRRDSNGKVLGWSSWCRDCSREASRESARKRRARNGVPLRTKISDEERRARRRARERRRYEAIKADPERLAAYRERRRMAETLRKMERGWQRKRLKPTKDQNGYSGTTGRHAAAARRYEAEPLLAQIAPYMDRLSPNVQRRLSDARRDGAISLYVIDLTLNELDMGHLLPILCGDEGEGEET